MHYVFVNNIKKKVYIKYKQMDRIRRQISEFNKDPPQNIMLLTNQQNLYEMVACIIGPAGTPYEDGLFYIDITLPIGYPFKAPQFRFRTPIYHPIVEQSGRIHCCFDRILGDQWFPALTVRKVLQCYKRYFDLNNINLSACNDYASQAHPDFIKDRQKFNKLAKLQAEKAKKINFYPNSKQLLAALIQNQNIQTLDLQADKYNTYLSKRHDSDICIPFIGTSLPKLSTLILNNKCIKDKGISCIIQSKQMWNLKQLSLVDNELTRTSIKYLTSMNWKLLQKLNLSNNNIQSEGLKCLLKGHWPMLTCLKINGCRIQNHGVQPLYINNWKQIHTLQLNNNYKTAITYFHIQASDFKKLAHFKAIIQLKFRQQYRRMSAQRFVNLVNHNM